MTKDEALKILPDMKGAGDDWDKAIDLAVEALKAQLTEKDTTSDCISRQAVRFIESNSDSYPEEWNDDYEKGFTDALNKVIALPSVQPEPLSDAYMKAVWTWLLDYQIKAAELKGRYTPYEVLSWVANDWRKEHE